MKRQPVAGSLQPAAKSGQERLSVGDVKERLVSLRPGAPFAHSTRPSYAGLAQGDITRSPGRTHSGQAPKVKLGSRVAGRAFPVLRLAVFVGRAREIEEVEGTEVLTSMSVLAMTRSFTPGARWKQRFSFLIGDVPPVTNATSSRLSFDGNLLLPSSFHLLR